MNMLPVEMFQNVFYLVIALVIFLGFLGILSVYLKFRYGS